jgi:hypothetical protein
MSYYINYPKMIDDALHGVVRNVLGVVAEEGLKDGHHFFVSFLTGARGVQLSSKVKQIYPKEITIVLQYQFKELVVREKYFSICLGFDGVSETVIVPYKAITAFSDPHAKTALQFRYYAEAEEEKNTDDFKDDVAFSCPDAVESSNIIPLDKFRKFNHKS